MSEQIEPPCETLTVIWLIQLLIFSEFIIKLFTDDVDADHGAERAESIAEDLPGLVGAEGRLQPIQRLRVQNWGRGQAPVRRGGEGLCEGSGERL